MEKKCVPPYEVMREFRSCLALYYCLQTGRKVIKNDPYIRSVNNFIKSQKVIFKEEDSGFEVFKKLRKKQLDYWCEKIMEDNIETVIYSNVRYGEIIKSAF